MRTAASLLSVIALIAFCLPAWAGSYQYLSQPEMKNRLQNNSPVHLLDIQVEQEFARHHLPGALASYAYPVKSTEDLAKLDAFVEQLKASADDIVIICPRGKGGAKRAYDHLQQQGIAAERLYILAKGQQGWPYPELLAKQ